MAINFYGSSKGFFDIAGKLFKTQADVNTSRGTTIPTDVVNLVTKFNNQTLTSALNALLQPITTAPAGYQSGAAGTMTTLQGFLQQFLITIVNADVPQADNSLTTALKQFIAQMVSQGVTVNASAVTVSVAAAGGNTGNGAAVVSKRGAAGLVQENALGESLVGTAAAASATAGFQFVSAAAASSPLGQDWPAGSGVSKSLTAVDANAAAGSLITNGGFETFTTQPNVPDSWIAVVGTPGTHLIATTNAVQTVAIGGTPTGGTYEIGYQNAAGKIQYTGPLAYNASAAAVQTALRALSDLASVTVVQTGTTPNFTNTITFTGVGGTVAALTYVNNMTGGTPTVTVATTTAGTPQVFAGGSALKFANDGATLIEIDQQLTQLSPLTAYGVSLWAICDSVPGAGVVKVELVDGINGTVINDAQGVANSLTFNASALTTSWKHLTALVSGECVFRTPAQLPALVFIRIRESTAVSNGKNMWVDNVGLAAMTEFYTGGPSAAIFTGGTPWNVNDAFTVTATNDRVGVVREWMERNLSLAAKELLLPTSGTPTVPDSVAT